MHRYLRSLTQSALHTLHIILNGVSHLANGLLHLIHTNEGIQILQDIVERALLGYIALDIIFLDNGLLTASTDKRREDIFGSLHSQMGITEGLVLDLYLILEIARQLLVGLLRESGDAILRLQLHLHHVAQFLTIRNGQAEHILEAVLDGGVVLKEFLKTLRQTSQDNDRITLPFIHLHKEFVEWVHLIGILIGQQFLHIIKKQDTVLCLFDVIIPLVHETLIVNSIYHCQLGFTDNLLLTEIITDNLCQSRLTSTRLTHDDGVDRQANGGDIFSCPQISISINYILKLRLHIFQAHKLIEHMLRHHWLAAPFAELSYVSVFLMTMFTFHCTLSC